MAEYNAADPRHIQGRKVQEKKELLRNEDAFKFVMGDIRGRNFVWHLISGTGLYDDSFTGNSSTFYNEGKRAIGLRLIADLEAVCPAEFVQMWQEHLAQKKKDADGDQAIRTGNNGEEFNMAEPTEGTGTITETGTTSLTDTANQGEKQVDTISKEQAGDKPADNKGAEQPVPEKYDLKLPKDVLVDETMMKEFTDFGKGNKWTNETAQKVADLHLKAIGALANKMDAEFVNTVEGWHNEIVNDKDIGGAKIDDSMVQARKVLAVAATVPGIKVDRLRADLEKTGMTTHPDIVRLLHFFGQFIGEDNKFIRGGTTSEGEQDAAAIMYGPTGVKQQSQS